MIVPVIVLERNESRQARMQALERAGRRRRVRGSIRVNYVEHRVACYFQDCDIILLRLLDSWLAFGNQCDSCQTCRTEAFATVKYSNAFAKPCLSGE
jgi:hypothetical protein